MSEDQYYTIAQASEGYFKDRGSKFFAYAFPCYEASDWQKALEQVKKEHFKARHHCFAYRMGLDQNQFRSNDDGEPSGTAGRPILGQIDRLTLTNIIVIVVRYFGGTKLGTSGLINAYRSAAADALEQAQIIQKTVEDIYCIQFDYGLMSEVMSAVKQLELNILTQDFSSTAQLYIAIAKSQTDSTLQQFKASVAGIHLEELSKTDSITGLQISLHSTR